MPARAESSSMTFVGEKGEYGRERDEPIAAVPPTRAPVAPKYARSLEVASRRRG